MIKWEAILHRKWIKQGENKIRGYWAEDESVYEIICPDQLVGQLIGLQNWLVDKYFKLLNHKREYDKLKDFFNS